MTAASNRSCSRQRGMQSVCRLVVRLCGCCNAVLRRHPRQREPQRRWRRPSWCPARCRCCPPAQAPRRSRLKVSTGPAHPALMSRCCQLYMMPIRHVCQHVRPGLIYLSATDKRACGSWSHGSEAPALLLYSANSSDARTCPGRRHCGVWDRRPAGALRGPVRLHTGSALVAAPAGRHFRR